MMQEGGYGAARDLSRPGVTPTKTKEDRRGETVLRLRHQAGHICVSASDGWASDKDVFSRLSRDLTLHFESFLSVQNLLVLTTVSSSFHAHLSSQDVWRSLFLLRWGSEYRVDPSTKVSPTLYSMISSTSFWATVERAFTLSPTISRNYKGDHQKQLPVTGRGHCREMSSWKLVFVLREQGRDLLTCSICNELDIFSAMSVWEAAQSITEGSSTLWVVPCDCAFAAHRLCLEKRLHMKRQWCSLFASQEEKARIMSQRIGDCPCCGKPLEVGLRLPLSFEELCRISWQDKEAWKHFFESIGAFLGAIAIHSLIAFGTQTQESSFETPSLILLWLFYQQTLLLQKVFLTERFAQVVRRVWRGPIFGTYLKLYAYFVLSVFLVFLGYSPLPGSVLTALSPDCWLLGLGSYMSTSYLFQTLLLIYSLAFFAIGSTIILVFWNTAYRVVTVSGQSREGEKGPTVYPDHLAMKVRSVLDLT